MNWEPACCPLETTTLFVSFIQFLSTRRSNSIIIVRYYYALVIYIDLFLDRWFPFKDIIAADHLRHLEMYIADEKHGKSLNELYEIVQYAGNILPRL